MFGFDPGFVEDLADRRADDALDAQAAALPRSPPGPRRTARSPAARRSPAPRSGRRSWPRDAPRSAAQRALRRCRRPRRDRCVWLARPPCDNKCCVNPRVKCKRRARRFAAALDPNRRIGFEPREPFSGHAPCPSNSRCPPFPRRWRRARSPNGWSRKATRSKSGDILAEIETDKATMEFEAVDEGTIAKILVPEGTDGVKVGAPIAILAGEGEDASKAARRPEGRHARPPRRRSAAAPSPKPTRPPSARRLRRPSRRRAAPPQPAAPSRAEGERVKASPLARRLAAGAGHRSVNAPGQRPRRPDRPRRHRRRGRQGASRGSGRRSRRGARARHASRHAGPDRAGDPARGGQALQHPQDHRSPPDGVEAAGPAHLSDGRHPARRAAQAPRRAQHGPRKPRREAQRQRPADQGARPGADRSAGMQRQPSPATRCSNTAAPTFRSRCRSRPA